MEQNLTKLQQEIKEQYESPQMSAGQVERLKVKMEQAKRENRRTRRKRVGIRLTAAAASIMLMLFVLPNTSQTVALAMQQIPLLGDFIELITVRNYEYADEKYHADINVGELVISKILETEQLEEPVKEELKKTVEEINAEIQKITDELIEHFKETVDAGEGHQETIVKSELLATTEDYFVVKLFCYRASGTGYQWNYYYTIDLSTGQQLTLADLFTEGADYVTPISENIIEQMQAQMAEDSMKVYWLDSSIEDLNFRKISENASFYINAAGNVVICFDEGDIAPMYMGALEFEIDNEAIRDIRK